MFGFLNLDKPSGWSSRKAVDLVQRLVRPAKVGHAGTLDPLARGVLVIAVGGATRLIRYLHERPKSYCATFEFGCRSESDDVETELTPVPIPESVTFEEIERRLKEQIGLTSQVPPRYSAVKVGGHRAYRLARRGRDFAISEREVNIHDAHVLSWNPPFLQIELTCSTGTYVRSVGRDLATALGTAAVMTALTRTAVGPFHLPDAVSPADVTGDSLATLLRSPLLALDHLAQCRLPDEEVVALRNGRPIPADSAWLPTAEEPMPAAEAVAIGSTGELVAIVQWQPDDRYWPACVFPPVRSA